MVITSRNYSANNRDEQMSRDIIRRPRESPAHWNHRGIPQCCCGSRVGGCTWWLSALASPMVHWFTTNFCFACIILILQSSKWINIMTADAIHTFLNEIRLLSRKIDQILNLFVSPDGASLRSAIAAARCGVTSSPSTFWLVEKLALWTRSPVVPNILGNS